MSDAKVSALFVLLRGILFANIQNIQVDDFQATHVRFVEIEGAEEREWIMMAFINLSYVLEGHPNGVLRKIGCVDTREANELVTASRGCLARDGQKKLPPACLAQLRSTGSTGAHGRRRREQRRR